MSQPKASEQRTTMLYRSWLSELKETKGALTRAPKGRAASRDTFDLNSQRLLLRFLRRSPCQVMTGDILLRSVPDWAGIQPIMSEWERWERTSREASSPLKPGSSPVSVLHGAASDRTHIVGFCVGLTATFSWCFLLLLLGECFDFLSQKCELAGVSLQSVRTYLSRHLEGETARLTGQTWPGSWLLGFFITYSCHCCCWLVSLLVHLLHKGLCLCC